MPPTVYSAAIAAGQSDATATAKISTCNRILRVTNQVVWGKEFSNPSAMNANAFPTFQAIASHIKVSDILKSALHG